MRLFCCFLSYGRPQHLLGQLARKWWPWGIALKSVGCASCSARVGAVSSLGGASRSVRIGAALSLQSAWASKSNRACRLALFHVEGFEWLMSDVLQCHTTLVEQAKDGPIIPLIFPLQKNHSCETMPPALSIVDFPFRVRKAVYSMCFRQGAADPCQNVEQEPTS